MHCSTDNESAGHRGAMVFHFARTGTVDTGHNPINELVTVR